MSMLVVVPDGTGVRNFVLGAFLPCAAQAGPVHVLHPIAKTLLPQLQPTLPSGVTWLPLPAYRDAPLRLGLRKTLVYAHMHHLNTVAMRANLAAPISGSLRARMVEVLTRRIGGRVLASRRGVQWLDSLHRAAVGATAQVASYHQILKACAPQVVFSTNQRSLAVLPVVLAAQARGIPTATFIFSWDNLTSKGRIVAPFDHYLVWSDHMRRELLHFYPAVSPQAVHVVGTPQFESYADGHLRWSRERFFAQLGADPARPLLCYSGGDAATCPEDPCHVAVLLDLIRSGAITGAPQVVVRPSPVDAGMRYQQVRQRYPELIYQAPRWVANDSADWTGIIPLAEDVTFLANLASHAAMNINLASTMTLDFAIHDKPVVNIAFDVADPPPFGKPLWDHYYQFDHYQPVVALGAARFARSPAELATHVNAYLADPTSDRRQRQQLVALQVAEPLAGSSQRIVDVLRQVAG